MPLPPPDDATLQRLGVTRIVDRPVGPDPLPPVLVEIQSDGSIEPARTAAVQRANEPPTSVVADRKLPGYAATDPRFLAGATSWQPYIRRYAHEVSVVNFVGNIVADTLSRCEMFVEVKNGKQWERSDDRAFDDLWDGYRNRRQVSEELHRFHAWFYETVGEMGQVVRDGPPGVEWHIYSWAMIQFYGDARSPNGGTAVVKDLPTGTVRDGTAFAVPRGQVTRLWNPHPEFQGLAQSPMMASVNDVHRIVALDRNARNTADSRLAMNGLIWFPGEVMRDEAATIDEPGSGAGGARTGGVSKQPTAVQNYYRVAQRRFEEFDNVAALAPYLVWWQHDWGAPEWVDVGRGLDEHGIAYKQDALADFGRGVNVPGLLVSAGGAGEGNHWSSWLVQEEYFKTIAPIIDRMTHMDLTWTYLWPWLRARGYTGDVTKFRIGYDPAKVIVRPDQSAHALALNTAGILNNTKTLEAAGFDELDLMPGAEFSRLLERLSAAHATTGGTGGGTPAAAPISAIGDRPQDQASTVHAPPVQPPVAPTRVAPPTNGNGTRALSPATAAADVPTVVVHNHYHADGARAAASTTTDRAEPERAAAARRALTRVYDLRREAGLRLRSAGDQAFRRAMHTAGVKLVSKAHSRKKSAAVKARVAAAVAGREALFPHCAAVGVTEDEMFRSAFDDYQAHAHRILLTSIAAQRRALANEGFDPDLLPGPDRNTLEAAGFLAAALLAIAYGRAADGHPLDPVVGEVSGDTPASIYRDALNIAVGADASIPSPSPDRMPDIVEIRDTPDLASALADVVNLDTGESAAGGEADVAYRWVWGFYGEPTRPFEPHEDLGASNFTTAMIEDDPSLANGGDWPDGAFYQPGDHDGCSCEWVPVLGARYSQEPSKSDLPGRSIPGLGADSASEQAALDAAGV